ncbi:hypothetical protein JL100_027330 [Skermanella mucosa]|uniref:hypothetical protein n=1 Tax=Skermanella mucosa TaxID=1789672 RepID=UPI00192C0A47|nr:hypothetical protein [Skermanella mucosa]UEM20748.1 hypothetical protein JL100_027330 [Skermanella mucosa]
MSSAGRRKATYRPQLDPSGESVRYTDTTPVSANERCRDCGRKHGTVVRCLADGRWFDAEDQTWRDRRGRRAAWPNVVEYAEVRDMPVTVRLVRLSGDVSGKLRKLCQRCQMSQEALRNAIRNRVRALSRRALGDLFLGGYNEPDQLERFKVLSPPRNRSPGARTGEKSVPEGRAPKKPDDPA